GYPKGFTFNRKFFVATVEDYLFGLFGNVFVWVVKREIKALRNGFKLFKNPRVFLRPMRRQSTSSNGEFWVRNNLVFIYFVQGANTIAFWACPFRRIKRKIVGFRIGVGNPRARTH